MLCPGAEGMRMTSAVVLTYPDREGADKLAAVLREVGFAAAAVPEEDEQRAGDMVWQVLVPEGDAPQAKALVEAVQRL